MSYLLDTNIVSELRKKQKCGPKVAAWMQSTMDVGHFICALTIGEIRNGIELLRAKDAAQAQAIEN